MVLSFVLDNSVSMSWFFKDQGGDYGDKVLDALVCGRLGFQDPPPIQAFEVPAFAGMTQENYVSRFGCGLKPATPP